MGSGVIDLRAAAALIAIVALVLGVLWTGAPPGREAAAAAPEGQGGNGLAGYANLPMTFVENEGQAPDRFRFSARGSGYAFGFAADEVVVSLLRQPGGGAAGKSSSARGVSLALRFVGGDPDVAIEGEAQASGRFHHLRGSDPTQWRTDVPGYTGVVYRQLWPGIDMVARGEDGALKYEFHVRPGADPDDIRLAYAGADGLEVADDGSLRIDTPLGALTDAAPVSWQEVDGERVAVDSDYALSEGSAEYGFDIGAYDDDQPLVVDPGLDYSTFLGGSTNEIGEGIAVDGDGSAYIVGTTQSDDLPATPGTIDGTFNGGVVDVFVAKLSADGSGLEYLTYLGGTPTPLRRGSGDPFEFGRGIAVDSGGHAYVTGQTTSDDFPTTSGAFQESINVTQDPNDATDGFVAKLTPDGSGLVYSTYLGGTNFEDTDGIAIDGSGNAYITGRTLSDDFPITSGAVQATRGGGYDGFVTKLNASGSGVVYSTYLGGADNEVTEDVVIDGDGNAYVAGSSRSVDFPTTAGAFQPTHPGGDFIDLFTTFVTKVDPSGSSLVYSTFLGGTKRDHAADLVVDAAGSAHVSGATQSPEFPTTAGAYDTAFDGSSEGFVSKLAADGSGLVYSTLLNGAPGGAIALDGTGNAWLAGGTASTGAPTTADAFSDTNSGSGDVWFGSLDADGSDLLFGSYFGGEGSDRATDIALDAAGDVYLTGTTRSLGFPTTAGAFQTALASTDPSIWGDAFVAKFGSGDGEVNPPPPPPTRTETFTDRIGRNTTVTHSVSVDASGTVDLHLDWEESRADLTLRVLDPDGAVVFSDGSSDRPKDGSFEAAATGSYQFEITNDTRRRTDYTLTVTVPESSGGTSAELTLLTLDPDSVAGGESATGMVALTAAAPSGGAAVQLVSSEPAVAAVPGSVTVPAGQTSATFTVSTEVVDANASADITASYGGASRTATLEVTSADGPALSSLSLDPQTVTGGDSSTGTVTLTGPAPSGGASVALVSSNTATATVPDGVTVPAGDTSATFVISTSEVDFDSSSAITASHGGESRTQILSVTPVSGDGGGGDGGGDDGGGDGGGDDGGGDGGGGDDGDADEVSIDRAEYRADKDELRVEAQSSSSSATLDVYVTATDEHIGTLGNDGGGDYQERFDWPSYPEEITVRSSLGGSATVSVDLD